MQSFLPHACLFLLIGLAPGTLLEADEGPAQGSWRMLPLLAGGKVHPDWVHIGWGAFVVEDESLRTECDERGMGLLLYKAEPFGNCQIRVVFRAKDAKSNAGVFVRVDPRILDKVNEKAPALRRDANGELSEEMLKQLEKASEQEVGPWFPVHHGYEVQICDAADPYHRTGAVYSLAKADSAPPAQPGEWRTLVISLDGNRIEVEVDGKHVTSFDPDAKDVPAQKVWHEPKREPKRPLVGYIGLQNHDPGDVVYFKEISVRPLPAGR